MATDPKNDILQKILERVADLAAGVRIMNDTLEILDTRLRIIEEALAEPAPTGPSPVAIALADLATAVAGQTETLQHLADAVGPAVTAGINDPWLAWLSDLEDDYAGIATWEADPDTFISWAIIRETRPTPAPSADQPNDGPDPC